MHNPLSALFEVARRFLPAGADAHLIQAEEHLRDAIRAEVEAQLKPVVERLLSAVRTTLAPASDPPTAPAAPTGTGSSDSLQASSRAPSAA